MTTQEDRLRVVFEEIAGDVTSLRDRSTALEQAVASISSSITDLQAGTAESVSVQRVIFDFEQDLLFRDGQIANTVLAVAHTYFNGNAQPSVDHKAQIASLEDNNVLYVYATGDDYINDTPQEGPISLGKGEVYVIENIQNGSIITSTGGAYGYSQQVNGTTARAPMPLLAYSAAITDTIFHAYDSADEDDGKVWCVNGPFENSLTLYYDDQSTAVLGQSDITLQPWQWIELDLDGAGDYRIASEQKIMAAIGTRMSSHEFYHCRLILPTSRELFVWASQEGGLSSSTNVDFEFWSNDNGENNGNVVAGSMRSYSAINVGLTVPDYEPEAFTRFTCPDPISAFAANDTAGNGATPACGLEFFTQRIAIPFFIDNAGDGAENSIAIGSPFLGTARLYQWNPTTGRAELVTVVSPDGDETTEIRLQRNSGAISSPDDQLHPAAALLSSEGDGGDDPSAYLLDTTFNGGYIEIDVPTICVINSDQNRTTLTETFRGTSGNNVAGISCRTQECLTLGISPADLKPTIRLGDDGMYWRSALNAGTETWSVA